MPSTVTTTRPDEATGFRHIGEPANALIERINATQHPNVVKMHDAIDGWVRLAKSLPKQEALDFLDRCLARIEATFDNLAESALGRTELWPHMEGVGAMDRFGAEARIRKARAQIEGEGA